jgi:hypothetical protein
VLGLNTNSLDLSGICGDEKRILWGISDFIVQFQSKQKNKFRSFFPFLQKRQEGLLYPKNLQKFVGTKTHLATQKPLIFFRALKKRIDFMFFS